MEKPSSISDKVEFIFDKFSAWRKVHIKDRNFIVMASIITGVIAGLAAVVLKWMVHTIQNTVQYDSDKANHNYLYLFVPLLGILLTVFFVQFIRKGVFVKGLSNLIFSLSKSKSDMAYHKIYSHMVTSAVTVGCGGSAGLEAPIVVTGSAIGANAGKLLRVGYKERMLLLASGAASGIAAVFNSPIAGVIFAFEVLLSEISIPAFIPLLISSAVAAVVSNALYSEKLFYFITEPWNIKALPFFVLLGICSGLISAYMIRVNHVMEDVFKSISSKYRKAVVGGILLGGFIFIFPPLYGEGYKMLQLLLTGDFSHLLDNSFFYQYADERWIPVFFALAIILFKVFATALTIGSGGNGGIFAPSLFTGAFLGFVVARTVTLLGIADLPISMFVAIGMAGVLSGVVRAPLTGIFLIAELTGGYTLFIPLMIVVATSFAVSRYIEPFSVYTKNLAKKKKWSGGNKDQSVLKQMVVSGLLEKDFMEIHPEMTLRDLVDVIAHSTRNLFPVVDKDGVFLGVLTLDDVRPIMFDQDQYDSIRVSYLMHQAPDTLSLFEDMDQVMAKFEEHGAWNLPVVEQGKYQGFVSRSTVFNQYRSLLKKHTLDY